MDYRQRYLSEVWAGHSYPSASGAAGVRGRLAEVGRSELIFQSGHKISGIETLELAPGYRVCDILLAGDIIEVLDTGSVRLLVPTRGEPSRRPEFFIERARAWQNFVKIVRGFFESEGFIELRTPTLVPSPGLEPHLDPFETDFVMGRETRKFYLPTSSEFHLKKALALGFEKCFEMKECFRNGEVSAHHQPEFLMLEWYRAYRDNNALIADVASLLKTLGCETALQVIPMEHLFRDRLNFHLTPQTTAAELADLALRLSLDFIEGENFDDLFARIFLERIDLSLGLSLGRALAEKDQPVIVTHFPPSQAALARLTHDGWADRFELYWRGFEIANAFHELNDPEEQRRRFNQDQKKKKELGKKIVPIDEDFMDHLRWGMPPSAGIALGMERLFMAFHGLKSLDEVRLFPV